jgi:hypothetical protein
MLAPLVVAGAATRFFHMPLPRNFWPALTFTLAGSAAMIAGKIPAAPAAHPSTLLGTLGTLGHGLVRVAATLSMHDLWGIILAIVSMLSLATFMLTVKVGGRGGKGAGGGKLA